MTDGARSNNGRYGARAGLGIVIGGYEGHCWSIPVDYGVDGDAPRTNQRAELLAAIEGLRRLLDEYRMDPHTYGHGSPQVRAHDCAQSSPTLVVATDSEYVVKGISEWFPNWRNNGWLNGRGVRPANLDLFSELDELVTDSEQDGFDVGFWHIPRAYNYRADDLAKQARS
ncbi:hypothetical protein DXG01_016843 [Tephrocybe rancida]|nr:hypothetical protein DXG01_016843 [Tephrocybe rancida]